MVLPIIMGATNPILRAKTKEISKITKETLALAKNMEESMRKADGVGLAAPQIGSDQRICLALLHGRVTPLVNPNITWKSAEMATAEEGCLSLPNIWVDVPRAQAIVVKYQTLKGEKKELRLEDMDARIVQHEVDHLDGTLIVDYAKGAVVL